MVSYGGDIQELCSRNLLHGLHDSTKTSLEEVHESEIYKYIFIILARGVYIW